MNTINQCIRIPCAQFAGYSIRKRWLKLRAIIYVTPEPDPFAPSYPSFQPSLFDRFQILHAGITMKFLKCFEFLADLKIVAFITRIKALVSAASPNLAGGATIVSFPANLGAFKVSHRSVRYRQSHRNSPHNRHNKVHNKPATLYVLASPCLFPCLIQTSNVFKKLHKSV